MSVPASDVHSIGGMKLIVLFSLFLKGKKISSEYEFSG